MVEIKFLGAFRAFHKHVKGPDSLSPHLSSSHLGCNSWVPWYLVQIYLNLSFKREWIGNNPDLTLLISS